MSHMFDPGISRTVPNLVHELSGIGRLFPDQFRVEWGPIFHRGRLDGSARVLVIGRTLLSMRRSCVVFWFGEAGKRLQGLLGKLGSLASYAIINTFLYSVYGSVKLQRPGTPSWIAYRNSWLDALLIGQKVEAVIAWDGCMTRPGRRGRRQRTGRPSVWLMHRLRIPLSRRALRKTTRRSG